MSLNSCHNFHDLRRLAKSRLLGPIFNYIDGGADDETTLRENTFAFDRRTHVLKALSLGAKALGVGRHYLYPLAAAGQPGVGRALGLLRAEIERDMKLMGVTKIDQLGRHNLRFAHAAEAPQVRMAAE